MSYLKSADRFKPSALEYIFQLCYLFNISFVSLGYLPTNSGNATNKITINQLS